MMHCSGAASDESTTSRRPEETIRTMKCKVFKTLADISLQMHYCVVLQN